MMASPDSLLQGVCLLKNLDALKFLPDVLNVLLDPTKKVIDDTCVENLLSWLTELAAMPVTLQNLFDKRSYVIGFLQKSVNSDCDHSTLAFALRLAAVLLNSLNQLPTNLQLPKDMQRKVGEDVQVYSCDEGLSVPCSCLMHLDTIRDLAEQLLIDARKLLYWHEASIRNAWYVLAKALIGRRCPSEIIQRLDILDRALLSLEDNSLFVVSVAQQFLANLIAAAHTCHYREDGPQSTHCCMEFPGDGDMQLMSGNVTLEVSTDYQKASEVSSKRHSMFPQECSGKSQDFPSKRMKLDPMKDMSNEAVKRHKCNCKSHLETCLHKLTAVLKPANLLHPLSFDLTSNWQTKLRTAAVGVLKAVIESWPIVGHTILENMPLVSVISELLESGNLISSDMCFAIVDWISVFLQTVDRESGLDSSVAGFMSDLPMKFMNINQFSPGIQLASYLFITKELSELKRIAFPLKMSSDTCTSLLMLVMLPVDCLLGLSEWGKLKSTSAMNAIKKCLLEEMTSRKSKCLTLLCQSLSAMENMVTQGVYPFEGLPTNIVDHVTSIMSLTLDQTSHHVTCSSLRCHLRGSLKVTKAALSLAMAIVTSCNGRLTETSVDSLFFQLTAVVDNPESDCSVVCKCFDILVPLLVCATNLKDKTDMMAVLGETTRKRSCDPRWEVRDSVICFLQNVLQCPAGIATKDLVHGWFECHNLHLRVLECTDDGESFVTASALSTLVDISNVPDLWKDLLQQTGKTEYALLGEFINVMLADSQGLARRAAVRIYTKWLTMFSWLQAGLPGNASSQEQERKDKQVTQATTKRSTLSRIDDEKLSVASQIRSGMSTAMFDLDWEVKLGALEFWQTLFEMYIPVRNERILSDAGTTRAENDLEKGSEAQQTNLSNAKEVVSDHESPTHITDLYVIELLKQEELVGRLVKVLDDEDRTVAVRACQMLLSLRNFLSGKVRNIKPISKNNDSDLEFSMKKIKKELDGMSLEAVLEEKMKVMDGYEEHPLSLLQDILAGTEDKEDIILDCY